MAGPKTRTKKTIDNIVAYSGKLGNMFHRSDIPERATKAALALHIVHNKQLRDTEQAILLRIIADSISDTGSTLRDHLEDMASPNRSKRSKDIPDEYKDLASVDRNRAIVINAPRCLELFLADALNTSFAAARPATERESDAAEIRYREVMQIVIDIVNTLIKKTAPKEQTSVTTATAAAIASAAPTIARPTQSDIKHEIKEQTSVTTATAAAAIASPEPAITRSTQSDTKHGTKEQPKHTTAASRSNPYQDPFSADTLTALTKFYAHATPAAPQPTAAAVVVAPPPQSAAATAGVEQKAIAIAVSPTLTFQQKMHAYVNKKDKYARGIEAGARFGMQQCRILAEKIESLQRVPTPYPSDYKINVVTNPPFPPTRVEFNQIYIQKNDDASGLQYGYRNPINGKWEDGDLKLHELKSRGLDLTSLDDSKRTSIISLIAQHKPTMALIAAKNDRNAQLTKSLQDLEGAYRQLKLLRFDQSSTDRIVVQQLFIFYKISLKDLNRKIRAQTTATREADRAEANFYARFTAFCRRKQNHVSQFDNALANIIENKWRSTDSRFLNYYAEHLEADKKRRSDEEKKHQTTTPEARMAAEEARMAAVAAYTGARDIRTGQILVENSNEQKTSTTTLPDINPDFNLSKEHKARVGEDQYKKDVFFILLKMEESIIEHAKQLRTYHEEHPTNFAQINAMANLIQEEILNLSKLANQAAAVSPMTGWFPSNFKKMIAGFQVRARQLFEAQVRLDLGTYALDREQLAADTNFQILAQHDPRRAKAMCDLVNEKTGIALIYTPPTVMPVLGVVQDEVKAEVKTQVTDSAVTAPAESSPVGVGHRADDRHSGSDSMLFSGLSNLSGENRQLSFLTQLGKLLTPESKNIGKSSLFSSSASFRRTVITDVEIKSSQPPETSPPPVILSRAAEPPELIVVFKEQKREVRDLGYKAIDVRKQIYSVKAELAYAIGDAVNQHVKSELAKTTIAAGLHNAQIQKIFLQVTTAIPDLNKIVHLKPDRNGEFMIELHYDDLVDFNLTDWIMTQFTQSDALETLPLANTILKSIEDAGYRIKIEGETRTLVKQVKKETPIAAAGAGAGAAGERKDAAAAGDAKSPAAAGEARSPAAEHESKETPIAGDGDDREDFDAAFDQRCPGHKETFNENYATLSKRRQEQYDSVRLGFKSLFEKLLQNIDDRAVLYSRYPQYAAAIKKCLNNEHFFDPSIFSANFSAEVKDQAMGSDASSEVTTKQLREKAMFRLNSHQIYSELSDLVRTLSSKNIRKKDGEDWLADLDDNGCQTLFLLHSNTKTNPAIDAATYQSTQTEAQRIRAKAHFLHGSISRAIANFLDGPPDHWRNKVACNEIKAQTGDLFYIENDQVCFNEAKIRQVDLEMVIKSLQSQKLYPVGSVILDPNRLLACKIATALEIYLDKQGRDDKAIAAVKSFIDATQKEGRKPFLKLKEDGTLDITFANFDPASYARWIDANQDSPLAKELNSLLQSRASGCMNDAIINMRHDLVKRIQHPIKRDVVVVATLRKIFAPPEPDIDNIGQALNHEDIRLTPDFLMMQSDNLLGYVNQQLAKLGSPRSGTLQYKAKKFIESRIAQYNVACAQRDNSGRTVQERYVEFNGLQVEAGPKLRADFPHLYPPAEVKASPDPAVPVPRPVAAAAPSLTPPASSKTPSEYRFITQIRELKARLFSPQHEVVELTQEQEQQILEELREMSLGEIIAANEVEIKARSQAVAVLVEQAEELLQLMTRTNELITAQGALVDQIWKNIQNARANTGLSKEDLADAMKLAALYDKPLDWALNKLAAKVGNKLLVTAAMQGIGIGLLIATGVAIPPLGIALCAATLVAGAACLAYSNAETIEKYLPDSYYRAVERFEDHLADIFDREHKLQEAPITYDMVYSKLCNMLTTKCTKLQLDSKQPNYVKTKQAFDHLIESCIAREGKVSHMAAESKALSQPARAVSAAAAARAAAPDEAYIVAKPFHLTRVPQCIADIKAEQQFTDLRAPDMRQQGTLSFFGFSSSNLDDTEQDFLALSVLLLAQVKADPRNANRALRTACRAENYMANKHWAKEGASALRELLDAPVEAAQSQSAPTA